MLHALYPGRIDLGIGRAPGGTPLDTFALQRYRGQQLSSDDFPDQMLELLAFLNRDFPAKHPFSRLTVYARHAGLSRGLAARLQYVERGGGGAARAALRVRAFHRFQSDPRRAGALFLALHCVAGFVRALRDGRAGRDLRRHANRSRAPAHERTPFSPPHPAGRRSPDSDSRGRDRRAGSVARSRRPPSSAIGRATSPAHPRAFATS